MLSEVAMAMVQWSAPATGRGNGVAAVASTSEIVGRNSATSWRRAGKRGLESKARVIVVGRASRLVQAAKRGGSGNLVNRTRLCEEERRGFLGGGGQRGGWFAGEIQQWSALRLESQGGC